MRLLAVDSCQLSVASGAAVNCSLTANRCQLQAALNYSKDLRFDVLFLAVVDFSALLSTSLLANIDKSSTCHTERR
jgi:hypothetical protein